VGLPFVLRTSVVRSKRSGRSWILPRPMRVDVEQVRRRAGSCAAPGARRCRARPVQRLGVGLLDLEHLQDVADRPPSGLRSSWAEHGKETRPCGDRFPDTIRPRAAGRSSSSFRSLLDLLALGQGARLSSRLADIHADARRDRFVEGEGSVRGTSRMRKRAVEGFVEILEDNDAQGAGNRETSSGSDQPAFQRCSPCCIAESRCLPTPVRVRFAEAGGRETVEEGGEMVEQRLAVGVPEPPGCSSSAPARPAFDDDADVRAQ